MPPTISRIVQALEPSATMAMATKAKELKASGQTVYDFSLGEPDFNTPQHICRAAIEAMEAGHTHYTQASGIPELKAAVAARYQEVHGLQYAPQQVVVSNGAKHSIHNVLTVLCDEGDEVIIPAPYWVSYAELIKLARGVPVIVETDLAANFTLTPEQLRQAITPKSKVLLLCSPSNPTGAMYSRDELAALADVAIENDLVVISDEIYENLVYGDRKFSSFATVRPDLVDRTVIVNGVSKSYAMTGWRIGWTLSPPALAKAMGSLQSQETSCPSSISQHAAVAALEGPQDCVAEMLKQFSMRREFVRRRLAEIPGLRFPEMDGAFYAFIDIKEHLGRNYGGVRVEGSTQWCLELLAQKQVASVMGSAFGAEGYARLSFAAGMDQLEAGLDRMAAFIKSAT